MPQSNLRADEDWTKIQELSTRRRLQNRISQRNHRQKIRKRLEQLEAAVASGSFIPPQDPELNMIDSPPMKPVGLEPTRPEKVDTSLKTAALIQPVPTTQEVEPFSMFPSSCSISDFEGESPKFAQLCGENDDFPMPEPLAIPNGGTAPSSYLPATPPVSERHFITLDPPDLVSPQELLPAFNPVRVNQNLFGHGTDNRGTSGIHGFGAKTTSSDFRHQRLEEAPLPAIAAEFDQHSYGYAASILPFNTSQLKPGTFSSPECISTIAPMTTSPSLLQYSDSLTLPTHSAIDASRPVGEVPGHPSFRPRTRSRRSRTMGKTAVKRPPHLRGQSLSYLPAAGSQSPFGDLSTTLPSPASPNKSSSSIADLGNQRTAHRRRASMATSNPQGFCPDCACQRVKLEETKMGKYVTLRVPVEELLHIKH